MTIHLIKSCISSKTCVLQRFKITTCRKVEFLHCGKEVSDRPGYRAKDGRQRFLLLSRLSTFVAMSPFKTFLSCEDEKYLLQEPFLGTEFQLKKKIKIYC